MTGTQENSQDNNVCIVGMGFVGLTLAVAMAEKGFRVIGVEIDDKKLQSLLDYKVHFHEEGLVERCKAQCQANRLKFCHPSVAGPLPTIDVFIMTVGTPLDDRGQPRMDMVERSARYIAETMTDGAMVVLRSTVKLGTTRSVVLPILEKSGKSFDLAYCSERTLEGRALEELTSLPQVIGGLNEESSARADQIFRRLTDKTVHTSSLEAAEIIKLLDNSYRDYSFAFGNEVALICEAAGLNASEVIATANWEYSRTNIPRPGFVGGPCLEKDPHILVASLQPFGFTPRLIKLARAQNEYLPVHVVENIGTWAKSQQGLPQNFKIGILGLAFKGVPETDDLRGTPAKILIKELKERWPEAQICGYDPICDPNDIRELGILPAPKALAGIYVLTSCDILIVANNNPKFGRVIDLVLFSSRSPRLVVDCWGTAVVDPVILTQTRTDYIRLGDNG